MRPFVLISTLLALSTGISPPIEAKEASPVIKYVYFVPKDIPFDQHAYNAVQKKARLFAQWCRHQFNGLAPDFKVDYLVGKHDWRWYVYAPNATTGNHTVQSQWRAAGTTAAETAEIYGNPRNDTNVIQFTHMHELAPAEDTYSGFSVEGRGIFVSYGEIELAYDNIPQQYQGAATMIGPMWGLTWSNLTNNCMAGPFGESCEYNDEQKETVLKHSGYYFKGHSGKLLSVREPPPTDVQVDDECGRPSEKDKLQCPQGSFCQPLNERLSKCIPMPAKCPIQEVDIDYFGNDLQHFYVNHPHECCDACFDMKECKAYTVDARSGRQICYLKSKAGRATKVLGLVSGILDSK